MCVSDGENKGSKSGKEKKWEKDGAPGCGFTLVCRDGSGFLDAN